MRVAAIVVASIALLLATPLILLVVWIFGSTIGDDFGTSAVFLALALVHGLFTLAALVLGTRDRRGLSIASLVMSGVSLLVSLGSFVIGPALLFGLSGA